LTASVTALLAAGPKMLKMLRIRLRREAMASTIDDLPTC